MVKLLQDTITKICQTVGCMSNERSQCNTDSYDKETLPGIPERKWDLLRPRQQDR